MDQLIGWVTDSSGPQGMGRVQVWGRLGESGGEAFREVDVGVSGTTFVFPPSRGRELLRFVFLKDKVLIIAHLGLN